MTVRLYIAAVLAAALLTGFGLAMLARGHLVAVIALTSVALLVTLPSLIWLLKETRR